MHPDPVNSGSTDSPTVTLADVERARDAISPHVRQTPMISAKALKQPLGDYDLWLKLECLQVTGSFKARGAVNKLLSLPQDLISRGIVTASGGNHGLAVAYAGWIAQVPTTIYLGENTPPAKAEKLRQWGASVVMEGADWDAANRAATALAAEKGLAYLHPFADPQIIAGQGTLGLEMLAALPQMDTLVVAIGGGGLISGISLAAKTLKPSLKIIGVEPVGAATLYESRRQGRVTELDQITTAANTLAPRRSAPINFGLIEQNVDQIVLVSDDDMRTAARWLWFELGVAAELSGAAAISALFTQYQPAAGEQVCALICGSGTDGIA
ncbi:threonine/serine dehydratase [Romeria aff. gracilis LEGE 07310]|uniref:threonine ammonia-lyase n=1 Tax=Vasconcelosia minhoensis LEGE 07310 TaxID=915328 RepID=A0A8J7AUK7_9CYAN|nr:threonine/serine dehydratase [Romeria gracilis]MBE9075777.1 threonine/serine dehydratase [Romeria aff. gracilis LEGE 07310]